MWCITLALHSCYLLWCVILHLALLLLVLVHCLCLALSLLFVVVHCPSPCTTIFVGFTFCLALMLLVEVCCPSHCVVIICYGVSSLTLRYSLLWFVTFTLRYYYFLLWYFVPHLALLFLVVVRHPHLMLLLLIVVRHLLLLHSMPFPSIHLIVFLLLWFVTPRFALLLTLVYWSDVIPPLSCHVQVLELGMWTSRCCVSS